jgi:hypothetical protein
MLGLFEREGAPWKAKEGIPQDFSFGEIEADWDRMTPFVEDAMSRVPIVQNYGIKALFCGPESFTPDNSPMVGESPELRNYFVRVDLRRLKLYCCYTRMLTFICITPFDILSGSGRLEFDWDSHWRRCGPPPGPVDQGKTCAR